MRALIPHPVPPSRSASAIRCIPARCNSTPTALATSLGSPAGSTSRGTRIAAAVPPRSTCRTMQQRRFTTTRRINRTRRPSTIWAGSATIARPTAIGISGTSTRVGSEARSAPPPRTLSFRPASPARVRSGRLLRPVRERGPARRPTPMSGCGAAVFPRSLSTPCQAAALQFPA